MAELMTSVPLADSQKVVFAAAISAAGNSVPPMAVTYWLLEGKSTERASCSAVVWSLLPEQSVEPVSPSAVTTDCPCVAACARRPLMLEYSPELRSDSQMP